LGFLSTAQTFSIILMPTAWVVAAFWGLVLWLATMKPHPSWWTWLAIGLLAGVVSMIVATILLLLPLVIVAIVLQAGAGQTVQLRLRSAIFAIVLLFAGVFHRLRSGLGPQLLYSPRIGPASAHGGPQLLDWQQSRSHWLPQNTAGASRQSGRFVEGLNHLARQETGRPLTRSEVSAYWAAKAKAWIAENRGAWWTLIGRKFTNFWNAFQYDDLSIISLLKSQDVLPPGIRFGVVAALALPGLLLSLVRVQRARWIVAAVCLHLAR
jgi:hypothetical protein